MPREAAVLLNEFLGIAQLLTNQTINVSRGRNDVNNILEYLDDESIEKQVRHLIKMSLEPDAIPVIKTIGERLLKFQNLRDPDKIEGIDIFDKLINAFCWHIDNMIEQKLSTVDWWGVLIRKNKVLFIQDSSDVINSLKCTPDNRLSLGISNFHHNKLFVVGSQLSTKITSKSM